MSKIDQIEEVLKTLKDIDGLKKERVDLIAQNDLMRDANAKLEQAERAADAANRHAQAVMAKAAAEAGETRQRADFEANAKLDLARSEADEILDAARSSANQIVNSTRAQMAEEREKLDAARLERQAVEAEVKNLEQKREQLTAAIEALKAVAKGI